MRPVTDEERAAVRRASGITARRTAYRLRAIVPHDDLPSLEVWGALATAGLARRVPTAAANFFYFRPELLRLTHAPEERMTEEVRRYFEAP